MKRFCMLFTALLFCIGIYAQIQRKFFGFNLGVTKKSEVTKYLKAKGKVFEITDNNSTIFVRDLKFGGSSWSTVAFVFYENILYVVYFSNSERYKPRQALDVEWESLKTTLSNKYEAYFNYTLSNSDEKIYEDNLTKLSLCYKYFSDDKSVILGYIDKDIQKKKYNKDTDEL